MGGVVLIFTENTWIIALLSSERGAIFFVFNYGFGNFSESFSVIIFNLITTI